MTLDVFGRHLTRTGANRIYLIKNAVPNIKRFYEQQLKKEQGNLIKSAQEELITNTDLGAAIEVVKEGRKDDLNKRTDYVVLNIDEYFRTVIASHNKRYKDFVKTNQNKLLPDVDKKN